MTGIRRRLDIYKLEEMDKLIKKTEDYGNAGTRTVISNWERAIKAPMSIDFELPNRKIVSLPREIIKLGIKLIQKP